MSVAAVRRVVSRLAPDRPPTDAELVLAIAPACAQREAAFAELVERYGSMVLGVCRRVLADAHDAEDAFQAAFLVLARKAATIRPPGTVGGWLYGVAVRTARKAKTAAARRRRREMAATVSAHSDREVGGELQRAELRAVIDDELTALPESQRAAVVLCDLHGKTRAEAASELDRPEGTVAAWLARGRKTLAARLARRGVALPAAGLVAVATPAVVSAELRSNAFAALFGRGVSPTALALAESVMRGLSSGTKLAAVLVAVGAVLVAVATAGAWPSGNDPKPDAPPIPLRAPAPEEPKPKMELNAWKEQKALTLPGWLGGSVCFSPDGKTLYVGGTGGFVHAYEAATMKKLWESQVPWDFAAVAPSPNGPTLAVTTFNGVRLIDAATGKLGETLEEGDSKPFAVGWFPDKPVLDPNTGQQLATSRKVIFGSGSGYVVKVWLEKSKLERGEPSTITANTTGAGKKPADEYAIPLAVSPDGKWAVSRGPIDRDTGKNVLWAWASGSGAQTKSLDGHKAEVVSAAWSKDGKLIVTGDADGVAIVWEVPSAKPEGVGEKFKEKSRLKLGGRVAGLALSADGKSAAAAVAQTGPNGYSEATFVWETAAAPEKPEPLATQAIGGAFRGFASVAFAPDGKTLVSCFANFDHLKRTGILIGRVRVFTLAPPPAVKPAPTAKPTTDVTFSSDGTRYLVVRGDKVEVYDSATGKQLYTVAGEAARFVGGTTDLVAMGPRAITVHDAQGKLTATHPRPKTDLAWHQVCFSPDGKRFAAHFGPYVRVYDTATGFEPVRLDNQFEQADWLMGGAVESVCFSADGKKVLACGVKLTEGGQMGAAVWEVTTGTRLHTFASTPKERVTAAVFAPNGDEVAIAYEDRVEVWAVGGEAKKNPVRKFATKDREQITALAYSHDDKALALGLRVRSFDRWWADVREAYKGEVSLVDAGTGTELRRLGGFKRDSVLLEDGKLKEPTPDVLRGNSGVWFDPLVTALAFSHDGKKLLAATALPYFGPTVAPIVKEGEVKLFALNEPDPAPKVASGRQWIDTAVLEDHGGLVNAVAVAPDGKSFLATTNNGMIVLWDAATRKPLASVNRATKGAYGVSFAADGKAVAIGSDMGVLGYEVPKLKLAAWSENHVKFGRVWAVALSPDGTRYAASDGYVMRVHRIDGKGEEVSLGKYPKGDAPVRPAGVAWSKDGKRLAVIRHDAEKDVTLWEPGEAEPKTHLVGHAERVTCVAWSADGRLIASGDEKGIVIAWDAATGKELWRHAFRGRDDTDGRINALAISPKDNTVAAAVSLGSGKGAERVVLLDGKSGADIEHLMRGRFAFTSVAWEKEGKYLVTGCGALPGEVVKQTEPAVGEVIVWERRR